MSSAIKKKAQPSTQAVDVEALISKGGSTPDEQTAAAPKDAKPAKDEAKNFMVLYPSRTELDKLDAHLAKQWPPVARSHWVIQAMREKAQREGIDL